MTDRELLELAAKAAGITGWQSKHGYWNMTDIDGKSVVCCSGWAKFNSDTGEPQNPTFSDAVAELDWNPDDDDGDALRLAVKIGMTISLMPPCEKDGYCSVVADWSDETGYPRTSISIKHAGEPYAATRRAIVCAAAEIGKAMP